MLLYPLYALLFAGAGLSDAQISLLFVIWSASGLVLEVPAGVLADRVSRRALLVVAPLLAGAGFALWVAVPAFWAFALGFVLWGAQGALQSGALEALVHDELERHGEADRFAAVLGRATALGTLAAALAMGLAAPVLAWGGYTAVGVASVAACCAAAVAGARLPEGPRSAGEDDEEPALREALAAVRRDPAVRRAVLAVPAVLALWGSLDEQLPLLAADAGAAPEAVALWGLLVYLAMTAGGALAGRAERALGPLLLASAAALAAGALLRVPAGLVLVALAFAGFQAATVVVQARLQRAISGPARATITSLASLLTEVAVIAVFAAYALGTAVASHAVLFAAAAGFYAVVGLNSGCASPRAARRRRPARPSRPAGR